MILHDYSGKKISKEDARAVLEGLVDGEAMENYPDVTRKALREIFEVDNPKKKTNVKSRGKFVENQQKFV